MGSRRGRGVRPGAGVCRAALAGLSFAPEVSLPPSQVTSCAQQVTEEPGKGEFTLVDPSRDSQGLRFGSDSS